MDTNRIHKIPDLDRSNYAPWYLALQTYAATTKSLEHLESNPPAPAEPQALDLFYEKKNKLLSAVLSSVPPNILGLLIVPQDRPTPFDLVQKIINHINQSTKEDHQFLKTEAESIPFKTDGDVDEFIKSHTETRQKMIAAQYPNIQDEETTVDFIITGIRKNPANNPIVAHILANKPQTIKEFIRKFKDLYPLSQPAVMTASSSTGYTQFTGDYGTAQFYNNQHGLPAYRGAYQYRSRPNYRRPYGRGIPYNKPRVPPHLLCSYHTSIGVYCNHTDQDCRDQNHPKFQKAQANYAQAHHPNQFGFPSQGQLPHNPYQLHTLPPPQYTLTPPAQPQQYHPAQATFTYPQQTAPLQPPQPDVASEANTEVNGTFLLDSGAHPSHLHRPTKEMTPLHNTILTESATYPPTQCTHHGTISLRLQPSKQNIRTYAVANQHINRNLISVKDLATRYGLVTFTTHRGSIYNTKTTPPVLIATAPWRNNHYELQGSTEPHSAYTVRALPYKTKNKPSKTKPRPSTKQTKASTSRRPSPRTKAAPPVTQPQKRKHTTKTLRHLSNPTHTGKPQSNVQTLYNWHLLLNHAHPSKLAITASRRLIPTMPTGLPTKPIISCSSCSTGKTHPAPHKRTTHNYKPGEYLSSDTCGPIQPNSRHGNNHILLIICAATRFAIAQFLKDRKDIPPRIEQTLHHIEHNMQHPLKHFRSDNAKEYMSRAMNTIYNDHRVTHHLRTPHQPQENSIAERFNRTVMNAVRAMLDAAGLDNTHWEDAARDAIFKYNLLYHSSIDDSPYSLWYGAKPRITRLYTFGQLGTIPVYAPKKKMESRADPARYMYPTSHTHIVVYNLKTMQYQHIRALDFKPYHKQADPTVQTTSAFKAKAYQQQNTPNTIKIDTPPPKNLAQARNYPDAKEWQKAHDEELNNIDRYDSIKWMPCNFTPPPNSIIPLMMHYRYKRTETGTIQQRKARCNLRGDLMKPGLHYDPRHTTTYTADRSTQRLLIALHASLQLPLEHFYIKSAYLHEKYQHDRPVYVPQMPRFDNTYKHDSQYGHLHGNLYGSPPAAYYYNHDLKTKLAAMGYTASEHDPCLYPKVEPDNTFTIVSTTIDDFLVLASTTKHIDKIYDELLSKYKIKRLGHPTRFLNWTIHRNDDHSIHISQPDSIRALLKQTGMNDCNPAQTPYSSLIHIDQAPDSPLLDAEEATRYRQILGEIRYITDSTRPDLTYATNRLAQHMSKPKRHHRQALKTILRYLQGTQTYGLLYHPVTKANGKPTAQLTTYSDADFANAKNRKSITGTVHSYNTTPISWLSKMQAVVALSTTEAEYIAATQATQHTQWLRKLLESSQNRESLPTPHYIDNRSAVLIAENQAPTKRRKYIDVRHHYVQHHVAEETIRLYRLPTESMLADMLTKPLHRDRFQSIRKQLNIMPRPGNASKCNAPTGDCQTFE